MRSRTPNDDEMVFISFQVTKGHRDKIDAFVKERFGVDRSVFIRACINVVMLTFNVIELPEAWRTRNAAMIMFRRMFGVLKLREDI